MNNILFDKQEICVLLDLISSKLDELSKDINYVSDVEEELVNIQTKLALMLINDSVNKDVKK